MTDDREPETSREPETTASAPGEKPEVGDVETRRHSRTLERPLTDEERLKIGAEMAEAMEAAGIAEAKKKAIDDELKGEIGKLWEKAGTLAQALRKGRREAMIECETIRDYRAGTVQVLRLDTGEEVEPLRAMTTAERQVGMFEGPTGRASEPEIVKGLGSYAEEADEENPQPQQNLGIVAPPPSPAEAIAQTAREEVPNA